MDILSLRLFVAAADRLNISAAGRDLGLGPAAASARLAKLERAVGADLLHRSTRKVSLSTEGAAFLPFAREVVTQADAGLAALGQGTAEVSGLVRFAASSTFAQLYVAPLLPELLDRHPGLSLDLRLTDLPFDPIEGSFDLALRSAPMADSGLMARKLADDPRVLVAAPAYLDAHGTPEGPDDLERHRLLAFGRSGPRPLLGPGGARSTFGEGERIRIDDGASQRAATLAGAGISANALWLVQDDLAQGRLVRVLPGWEVDDRAVLWLVYPKANVLTAKVRVLIDFLVERIGRQLPWQTSGSLSADREG
ncbi:LysR family transcriptional regulator [uncultured Jannaschia sp.]|uniref:LysR family transcriptional regulator n=1 Tax=uncultured Jannaschia sp. TaxID=293347 RepID=UPI00261CB2AC|nr:LysR family transcriptional regulator [uncultured Jannaschia sp.]